MSDIRPWLEELGLGQYGDAFEENRIDVDILVDLTDSDLKDLEIPLGDRKRILKAAGGHEISNQQVAETAGVGNAEAERRQITVMFCDLVGSTRLSEELDPEDLRALMQAYQQAAGGVIERYQGHVAQYLGDGLMTYFGWPMAHEDDAERAVRASLEIVETVQEVEAPSPLHVRIGIATGPVVVGETGAGDASVPKLAVGETPNLAARLQGLAGPGDVVIGPLTYQLVGNAVVADDLGENALKGIARPVPAWKVTGFADAEGRFESTRGGRLTNFVGRDSEVAFLMQKWERAKDGEGQVVLLSGEPGIGKSRITQELRERISQQPHSLLRYQCSPFHTNSTLHPMIEQLTRAAGFEVDDDATAKLTKLEKLVGDEGTTPALLGALLGLDNGGRYAPLNMSPQKQKEETLKALADQLVALSADLPVLMIFEDVHWIDPSSQEALDLIVPRLDGTSILLVVTYRPEYSPPWPRELAHVSAMGLGRLARTQVAGMISSVTGNTPLPDEILDQIVSKTDGVPLFVEELTKTVLETGTEATTAIPSTLHDSLMARLDRLSSVKEIAQIGACIGRQFSHALLMAVAPLGETELVRALQQLIKSELVYRSTTGGENSYTFKHALVQDTAYSSLLKSRKQQIHGQIAAALEDGFPSHVRAEPSILAEHYTRAGQFDAAVPYWLQASLKAFRQVAYSEARAYAENGIELLNRTTATSERSTLTIALHNLLGNILLNMSGYGSHEAAAAFEVAGDLLEEVEINPTIVGNAWGVAVYHWVHGRLDESEKHLRRIVTRVNNLAQPDHDLVMICNSRLGMLHAVIGRVPEAIRTLTDAISSYDIERHRESYLVVGTDIGASSMGWLATALTYGGKRNQARQQLKSGLELSKSINHPFTTTMVLALASLAASEARDIREAIRRAIQCREFSQDQNLPFWGGWARGSQGYALALSGEVARGIIELEGAIEDLSQIGSANHLPWFGGYLAEARLFNGDVDAARDLANRSRDLTQQQGQYLQQPMCEHVLGQTFLAGARPEPEAAEQLFVQSMDSAAKMGIKLWELRAATSLSRLRQSQGKMSEAADLLAPVYDWFTEGFDTADLKDAKALLEELK
jgi:class 3 adenylate cyclase